MEICSLFRLHCFPPHSAAGSEVQETTRLNCSLFKPAASLHSFLCLGVFLTLRLGVGEVEHGAQKYSVVLIFKKMDKKLTPISSKEKHPLPIIVLMSLGCFWIFYCNGNSLSETAASPLPSVLCTKTKRKRVSACFMKLDPQPAIFMICVPVKGKERGKKQEHKTDKGKEATFFLSCPRTDRSLARADL